jgi:Concanavalin A-like lectin/glucanases superfamily/Fibronectin type III domain
VSQLPTNTWSYLAATYDGATLRLYLNGVLVSTQSAGGAITSTTNPITIGSDSFFGQYFSGRIDEVRVYNAALSGMQIQTDMNEEGTGVPSAPTNLTAAVPGTTEVDLTWGASTDNAGVTGYRVERCQGTGCTSFTQIGTPSGTSFNDTGLTPSTTYVYRVRAIDAAGKLGPYSSPLTTFTGVMLTPHQATLTPGQTQQYNASLPGGGSASVIWSVDGVVGGTASVGTVSSSGLYTAPASAGTHTITAATSDGSLSASGTANISNYPGTFTFHNDNLRTGANLTETVLAPSKVNTSTFGKLFQVPLDGVPHASPLYVENVAVPNQGTRNLVYIATEHDSVYAYDADGRSTTPIWKDSFIDPAHGVTTVPAADVGECCDIAPEIGITSTPVIDRSTNTMYVVAKTKEVSGGTRYVQRLHALDIATGAEKFGAPVVIQASVPGTGNGTVNGQIPFDSLRENQRTGLLLLNGTVYFAFGSHGDNQPYHGWVLGYNATTLQQTLVWNATPNQEGAGIWMSGEGLATDASGAIFFVTGDGEFDGGTAWGDSYVKLTTTGVVSDFFTPFNQGALNTANHDLGAGGPVLLPDQPGPHPHEMIASGKDGSVYLVDRDNMGHYNTSTNNNVQTLGNIFTAGTPEPGNFSAPVYWNGYVFFGPLGENVQGFRLTNGLLPTSPTLRSAVTFTDDRGAALSASSNGTSNGIVWAVQRSGTTAPGTLYAYDPAGSTGGVFKELWNSNQAGTRDTLDIAAKFSIPTVANGKVYVAGFNSLTVYGLLP